eukprot:scaffold4492_cov138-Skeletonema_marinoi.AAC.2
MVENTVLGFVWVLLWWWRGGLFSNFAKPNQLQVPANQSASRIERPKKMWSAAPAGPLPHYCVPQSAKSALGDEGSC